MIYTQDVNKVWLEISLTLLDMTIYMALAKDEKLDIIKKFAREKGDTGSPEVQIASYQTNRKISFSP